MLKLMIVDDEVVIREGLKNTFNWNELGFEIVAEAENGIDAIDLFYETLPDVVITDIYMQKGDGLEFIKNLKKASHKVEIIVISGYPNFEYAQTALNSGVFAYLLKPVSMSEIIETITKVKEKILSNNTANDEKFLFNLLQQSSPDKNSVNALANKYHTQIPSSQYFIVTAQIESSDSNTVYDQLLTSFHHQLSDKCTLYICQPRHYHIALLLFFDNNSIKNLLYITLNDIKEEFRSLHNISISIGISNVFDNLCDIRNAYLQSLFCLSQKALHGKGSMISYETNILNTSSDHEDQLTTISIPTTKELNDILSAVNTFNIQLLNDALSKYFKRIKELYCVNISTLKNTISELVLQIIYTAVPDPEAKKLIFGSGFSPISEISALDTISEIENYIFNITGLLFKHHTSLLSNNNSPLIRDVKIYIMTNYPLPISIDTIADELHVTRHHLMRLFKTETGETINEFLTNYRINIALALLKDNDLTISEIAQRVGYQDANYFSKTFKKVTGTTPSKYLSKE